MQLLKVAFALAACTLPTSGAERDRVREARAAESGPLVSIERVSDRGGEILLARNASRTPITLVLELEAASNARATWERAGRGVVVLPDSAAFVGRVDPDRMGEPWSYRWRERWWIGSRDAEPDPDVAYNSPLALSARIVQGFHGAQSHREAETYAVDLECPLRTRVHAARAGVVVEVREDSDRGGDDPALRDEANFVRVLHADGTLGFYAHFARNGVEVEVGQRLARGALLGFTGTSGWMAAPHVHFAVAVADPRWGWRSVPFRFERGAASPSEPREGEVLEGSSARGG